MGSNQHPTIRENNDKIFSDPQSIVQSDPMDSVFEESMDDVLRAALRKVLMTGEQHHAIIKANSRRQAKKFKRLCVRCLRRIGVPFTSHGLMVHLPGGKSIRVVFEFGEDID